jgi:hypothetical protein
MKTTNKRQITVCCVSLAAIAGLISGCGTTTPSSQPSTAQPAPQAVSGSTVKVEDYTPTVEDQDWDAALKPFTVTKVEAFIRQYPNGKHMAEARRILDDEHVIEQIIASGPGSHFILPKESIPSRIIPQEAAPIGTRARIRFIVAEPLVYKSIVFGEVPIYNGQVVMPKADLCVVEVDGTFENIQGDPPGGIRILHSNQFGFIVIGGKGKIFSSHNGVNGDIIFQTQP